MPAYVVVTLPHGGARRGVPGTTSLTGDPRIQRLLADYHATLLPAPETGSGQGNTSSRVYAVPEMAIATTLAAALRAIGVDAFAKPGEELP